MNAVRFQGGGRPAQVTDVPKPKAGPGRGLMVSCVRMRGVELLRLICRVLMMVHKK
jgi:hypothetical protein